MSDETRGENGTGQAEAFWERHYQAHERAWSGRANAILVDIVQSLPPGRALDLGAAEGGDAIWLAGTGWHVTAVDVSTTALERGAARADAAGVADRIDFQRHDLTVSLPGGTFDLISAQYLHSPVEFPRERVLRDASALVAPGGILLVVDHASVMPWSWNADPDTRFPTPEATLAGLELSSDEWQAERLDAPQRQATGPDGQVATVTDNVIVVRRRPI